MTATALCASIQPACDFFGKPLLSDYAREMSRASRPFPEVEGQRLKVKVRAKTLDLLAFRLRFFNFTFPR
jgi:hypothetical protein